MHQITALSLAQGLWKQIEDAWTRPDEDLGRNYLNIGPGQTREVLSSSRVPRPSQMASVFLDLDWRGKPPSTNRANVRALVKFGQGATLRNFVCDWPQGTVLVLPITGLSLSAFYEHLDPQPFDVVEPVDCSAVVSYTTHGSLQFADVVTYTDFLPQIAAGSGATIRVPKFARDLTIFQASGAPYVPNSLRVDTFRDASSARGSYLIPELPFSVALSPDLFTAAFANIGAGPLDVIAQYGLTF